MAIEGSFCAHKKQNLAWSQNLLTLSITYKKAWMAMNTTILKQLKYTLSSITFKKSECDELRQILMTAALPKSGMPESMLRKIVMVPNLSLGLGF